MSGRSFNRIIYTLIFLLAVLPSSAWAYSEYITHEGLSEAVVDVYEQSFGEKFTDQESKRIIEGARDEDLGGLGVRPLNHFYDPTYSMGLYGYNSAIDWALKDSALNDYSWPKAIQLYAEGQNIEAYYALGHILHLIEDMSVPDHTRSDQHLDGSPFEGWVKNNFTQADLVKISKDYSISNPQDFSDAKAYFEFIAQYSNENFYSKDTINNNDSFYEHDVPSIEKEDEKYAYATDSLYGDNHIILGKFIDENKKQVYLLIDPDKKDPSVFQDYFSRLSKQAVINGVGLIKIFFAEGEKARTAYKEKQIIERNRIDLENKKLDESLSKKGTVGLIFSGFGFWVSDSAAYIGKVAKSVGYSVKTTGREVAEISSNLTSVAKNGSSQVVKYTTKSNTEITTSTTSKTTSLLDMLTDLYNKASISLATIFNPDEYAKNITAVTSNILPVNNQKDNSTSTPIKDIDSYRTPIIKTAPSDNTENSLPEDVIIDISISDIQNFAEKFKELLTQEAAKNLPDVSTLQDVASNLSFVPIYFSGGGSTIVGEIQTIVPVSDSTSTAITSTTTEPIIILPKLSIKNDPCFKTISQDKCILLSATTTVGWSSDQVADYYILKINNQISSTTSTSTEITLSATSSTIVEISVVNTEGLVSNVERREIFQTVKPVIINEIFYTGTTNYPDLQWLELYNPNDYSIPLEDSFIKNSSSTIEIKLNGVISPKGYYVIERQVSSSTNSVLTKPIANLTTSFGSGLDKTGEDLTLSFGSENPTIYDEVPYCENWCNLGSATSLERYDDRANDATYSNWSNTKSELNNPTLVGDEKILGTPGFRNNISYIINQGKKLSGEVILTKANSPYLVEGGLIVPPGSFLKMEAGTIIKFSPGSQNVISGNITTFGGDESVVWTCYADDEYGGDTFGDGNSDLIDPTTGKAKFKLADMFDYTSISYGEGENNLNNMLFRCEYGGISVHSTNHVTFNNLSFEQAVPLNNVEYDSKVDINNFYINEQGEGPDRGWDSHPDGVWSWWQTANSVVNIKNIESKSGLRIQVYASSTLLIDNGVFDGNNYNCNFKVVNGKLKFNNVTLNNCKNENEIGVDYDSEISLSNSNLSNTIIVAREHVLIELYNVQLTKDKISSSSLIMSSRLSTVRIASSSLSSNSGYGLVSSEGDGEISNSTFSGFSDAAISSVGNVANSTFKISDSEFKNNGVGINTYSTNLTGERLKIHDNNIGMQVNRGEVRISNSTFENNSTMAVKNMLPVYGAAFWNNWWGDYTGPKNIRTNPLGLGGEVSNGIIFKPWYISTEMTKTNRDVVVATTTQTVEMPKTQMVIETPVVEPVIVVVTTATTTAEEKILETTTSTIVDIVSDVVNEPIMEDSMVSTSSEPASGGVTTSEGDEVPLDDTTTQN